MQDDPCDAFGPTSTAVHEVVRKKVTEVPWIETFEKLRALRPRLSARSQDGSSDAVINSRTGLLTHKRWLNADGSPKTGEALENEKLMAEIEKMGRRLLLVAAGQSHRSSWVEAVCGTAIGFVVAVVANFAVLPFFGYTPTFNDSLTIAAIFTLISVVRSFFVRRLFERLRVKGILP